MSDNAQKTSSKTVRAPKTPSGPIPAPLQPWAIAGAALPAAFVAHPFVAHDPMLTAGMGAVSVVLTGVTRLTWKNRHEYTRTLATVFVGSVTGWFTLAAGDGIDSGMVKLWALGGIALSAAWNLRHFAMSPQHDADKAEGTKDPLFGKVAALAGGRTRKIKESGANRLEAEVQLKPGEGTAEDVVSARTNIASAVGMGAEDVTVTPVRGRADRVRLAFQPSDTALQVRTWEGPSAPGSSVHDSPLIYGVRPDGSVMGAWVCGDDALTDPRPLGHFLVTGAPNAGKTEAVKTIIIEGRTRKDFCAVVGDPDKFEQSFGEIADTLSIAAKGPQQTSRLVRNLPDAIRYRAELLGTLERSDGTRGYPQWEPECWTKHRIPVVLVDIEEAATVLSSVDDEFDTAVRTARSVGIVIVASMQSAHHQNIDRKTRGLFANALTFGLMEDFDAKFALSPKTREAGADPTKWGANKPGMHYAEVVGTPDTVWPQEGRAYRLTRAQKREILDRYRDQAAVLDPGTAMALGAGIVMPDAKLTARLPIITDDPETDPEEEGMDEEEQVTDYHAIQTEDGAVDITQPIASHVSTVPFQLRPKKSDVSKEQAQAIVAQRLDDLEEAGRDDVTFDDLADLVVDTGRSRQWMYGELKRLVEEGRLTTDSGRPPYRIKRRKINGVTVH